MAITVHTNPQKLMPVYQPLITVVSSTNSNLPGHQFLFDLYSASTSTRIARVEKPADPNGYGIDDASGIVSKRVSYNIFPTLTGFTTAPASHINYDVQIGEEYQFTFPFTANFNSSGNVGFSSTTSVHYFSAGDRVLISQQSGAVNSQYNGVHTILTVPNNSSFTIDVSYGSVAGSGNTGTCIYSDYRKTQFSGITAVSGLCGFNGAVPYVNWRTYSFSTYHIYSGGTGEFLTAIPNYYKVRTDSRGWVNLWKSGSTNPVVYLIIQTDAGTSAQITNSQTANFQTVGVFPWNLNNATLSVGTQPIISSLVTRYSAWTETATRVRTSEILVFDIDNSCAVKFANYQLIFQDRFGSFIPFTFTLANKKTVNKEITTYKKGLGSYNASTNSWGYNTYDRGETVLNTDFTKQITVTSDWVSEEDYDFLEQLLTSPEVYHFDGTNLLPIKIIDNNWPDKQRVTSKLINVTLSFVYAFNEIVQTG